MMVETYGGRDSLVSWGLPPMPGARADRDSAWPRANPSWAGEWKGRFRTRTRDTDPFYPKDSKVGSGMRDLLKRSWCP